MKIKVYQKHSIGQWLSKSIIDNKSPRKLLSFLCPNDWVQKRFQLLGSSLDGQTFISFDKNVKTAFESCYGYVTTGVIFTSKRRLPVARNDILPITLALFINIRATVTVSTLTNIKATTRSNQAACS